MADLIDRQAAIDAISEYGSVWMEYKDSMSTEEIAQKALDSAKKAVLIVLSELPSAQPEPCEDAVSRKLVIRAFTQLWSLLNTVADRDEWEDICRTTANILRPVTPEPCENTITIDWLTNYMNGMIAGSERWWGVKWMLEDWTKSRENKNHDT